MILASSGSLLNTAEIAPSVSCHPIVVTATFTAEPLEESLCFWMAKLQRPSTIEFAPYNQVFQQLLQPTSLLAQNRQGTSLVLVRFEDWQQAEGTQGRTSLAETVQRTVQELAIALKAAAARTTILFALCPDSPAAKADADWVNLCQQMERWLIDELSTVTGLHLITALDLARYPVNDYYDQQRDALGHIPFTPAFFTALGTVFARKLYALKSTPRKVIVLDCDNTLWQGVVGEDGVLGVEVPPAWHFLQDFMVEQQQAGMLLCLCSKNNEAEALEVFERHPAMRLRREQLVSWRINWLPKGENIQALAKELNLGLDSFIFIDDNPVECAEVQARCPDVLVLQLPAEQEIVPFLTHVWAFDRLKVTAEDQQRTEQYQQNVQRQQLQQNSLTLEVFLTGLELNVTITAPSEAQLPRVAQLTQRTNQFNTTTIRRSETDLQQLAQAGLECRIVEVSDRFGDYGLVGVMIVGSSANGLTVESLLLSCRVLGRGVEYRMLNYLAEVALERHLAQINLSYSPTAKNRPMLNFLETVRSRHKQAVAHSEDFSFPVEFLATLTYDPNMSSLEMDDRPATTAVSSSTGVSSTGSTQLVNQSLLLSEIARECRDPEQMLSAIAATVSTRSLNQPATAATSALEIALVHLWSQVLRLEAIGIDDNYFDLGGTSIKAVELFTQLEQRCGQKLPLSTLLEAPTIKQLAQVLQQEAVTWSPLVAIQPKGTKPPLFCPHAGEGNVLFYRPIALLLGEDQPFYALQPRGLDGRQPPQTQVEVMATEYIEAIRTVQPHGPYYLGGFCGGGLIAYEMACQLQAQGETVALVALMESIVPTLEYGYHPSPGYQLYLHCFNLSRLSLSQKLSYLCRLYGFNYELHLQAWQRSVAQLGLSNKLLKIAKSLPARLLVRLKRDQPSQPVSVEAERLHQVDQALRQSLRATFERYRPQTYAGQVTLFRTLERPHDIFYEPTLGWSTLATGGVAVQDIPGHHHSLVNLEFSYSALASALKTVLQQAQQQQSEHGTPDYSDSHLREGQA